MPKLEIKLNERQAISKNKYALSALYSAIKKPFAKFRFRCKQLEDGPLCYYGNSRPRAMESLTD